MEINYIYLKNFSNFDIMENYHVARFENTTFKKNYWN